MKVNKLTGIALATAAAGLFATTQVYAASHAGAAQGAKVKCEGVNACKGKGDCKGSKNECKGKAACKGQGFTELSKADCDKAKAEMKK
ncbi:MAG: BufA2 family periplasmic bufferin-type metallophore [Terriglobales bacterium]